MNDILKQRLVGALVLIAVGVAFWPVIFVESERVEVDTTPQVKPMPELEEVYIPAPQPIADVEPVSVVDDMRMAAAAEEAEETGSTLPEAVTSDEPASPVLDERGIPVAWVLQVATVSSRERAQALSGELIAAGYKAYHRPLERDDAVWHRVYVGPVFEREKLDRAKQDIDAAFKVSAIVARYVP